MSELDLSKPPTQPPAVSLLATKLYYEGGRKLDDAALERLQAELERLRGDDQSLFWSFVGLEALNQLLTKAGDKATGDRIWTFLLAQRDHFPDLETKLQALSQDRAQALQSAAQNLIGGAAKGGAPVFGKAVPKGTTRLSDLIPQANLRPPVPRKK
ncbi:MAG: hypothetical protein IPG45_07380 [Deltaproteobacteria bacterium]|nr:hypothetical protein [Deltaproteobacteria bacterium]